MEILEQQMRIIMKGEGLNKIYSLKNQENKERENFEMGIQDRNRKVWKVLLHSYQWEEGKFAMLRRHLFLWVIIYVLLKAVNFICDHPDIKAISFVGSNQAGEYIFERGSRHGKRVQANMVTSYSFFPQNSVTCIKIQLNSVLALFLPSTILF